MLKNRLVRATLAVLLVLITLAVCAVAQTSRGTVSGVVTDATGAVVTNAKVTLTQTETGVARETETNAAGIYRFDAVNLGTYKVKVTAQGFSAAETINVEVRANQNSAVDFALKVGGSSQTVEVEAAAAAVALQTEEQLRGGNIQARSLSELPVGGQNSLNLMVLLPGVVPTNLSGGGGLDSGIGSVNGSRPRANNFMVDGVENNDVSVAGPAITLTNNDAIQEVSIQTANFSAEFGRSGGGVINQITKSGTNKLHGTAAWVYRSQRLNASSFDERMTYFVDGGKDAGDPLKPAFLEHIPAFTVGGPVYIPHVYDGHNKTFFFVAGQWDRLNEGANTRTVTVPTAEGIATLKSLAVTCPNAQLYLNSIGSMVAKKKLPTDISLAVASSLAGTTCTGTDRAGAVLEVGRDTRYAPSIYKGNTQQARVDHNISDKHAVSFRFMSSPGGYPGASNLGMSPEFDTGFTSTSYTGGITDTYTISSRMTNELRLNYFRVTLDWPLLGGNLGATLPSINITGVTTLGTNGDRPQGRTFNNYALQDTMTFISGKHTLRYGFDINKQIARQMAPSTNRGQLTYSNSPGVSGFANFLDDYSGVGLAVIVKNFGSPVYHPSAFRQSYFAQDSWKVLPTLTLNLGVRYDYFGQPANENFPFPATSLNPSVYPNKDRIPEDKNNWAPTVGFAWNPKFGIFSDGKTVFRGGYQIGYDGWFNNMFSNMAVGSPNNPTGTPYRGVANSNTPRGVSQMTTKLANLTAVAPTNPLADNTSQFTPWIRNPYTMRWSLGVQRDMVRNLIFDVSYVASLGRKLFINREMNPYTPAGTRLNSAMGGRTVRDSAGNSNYNSLQIGVRNRTWNTFLGGINFDSSYTWSKNLDTASEVFTTSSQGTSYGSSRWMALQDLSIEYGPSDLDRRHRWATTVMWDIRGPKSGILGQAFGGWSIGATIPITSGTPFSVMNGIGIDRDGDGSYWGDRPDIGNLHAPITSRALVSTSCASGLLNPDTNACTTADQVRWVQSHGMPSAKTARRNSVYTEGQIYADVNILKKFKIGEGKFFEARAEIFNIANSMNFNYAPNGLDLEGMYLSTPGTGFLPWKTEIDGYTHPGHRTMRLGVKLIF